MNLTIPKPHFDWTINVTNLLTIAFFSVSLIASWYDMKTEIAVNKALSDSKFSVITEALAEQQEVNKDEDAKIYKFSKDLQQDYTDRLNNINEDIRILQQEESKKSH